jgi:hypothetical protein
MTSPAQPDGIDALIGRWGQAFIIYYARDRWLAMRRDDGFFLPADTLAQLEAEMDTEITKRPLDTEAGDGHQHLAEYLGPELAARFGLTGPNPADHPSQDDDDEPADDESLLLAPLRDAFPAWTIDYSTHARAWTARTRKTTIRQPTAALLCAALELADRQARRTSDPGPAPWPDLPSGTT